MSRARFTRSHSLALLAVVAAFAATVTAQDSPRLVAVGDVHGAYASFVGVLRKAGLVDDALAWTGGGSRLIVLGDVLDRGAESRRALELVKALQPRAADAGGAVELVLGNHEVMNLLGDLRYVTPAELATYAADDAPAERNAAWQRFSATAGDTPESRERFATRYPPGFFGHRAAFAPTGVLGSWLLERPVLVTIDETAFVHGGLPAALADKTTRELNAEYRAALREYFAAVAELEVAGIVHREDGLAERTALAERYLADTSGETSTRRAAERVAAFVRSPLLGGDAVFWYRGTATCSAAIEQSRLETVLESLGAKRVVIGHTPTRGAVLTRFAGRVIRADTGMLPAYGGVPAAVVIRGDEVLTVYANEADARAPAAQPRTVGAGIAGLGDDELAQLLVGAPVLSRTPRSDGTELWQLERNGDAVNAVFRPAPRRGFAALPEVAAYRLDRLLDLDLVPVTVRRENEGRVGSLRLDDSRLPNERQRAANASAEASCPLLDQFNAMYVFDILTHNDGRRPESMRYRAADWSLVLTDNQGLFSLATDVPAYLRQAPVQIPAHLATLLRGLDEATLATSLGDVLDAPRRTALLERRDRLLAR
jgi:hypothetical protein